MGKKTEKLQRVVKKLANRYGAGDEDVVRKLMGDLTSAGVDTNDTTVRQALADATVEARRQMMEAK